MQIVVEYGLWMPVSLPLEVCYRLFFGFGLCFNSCVPVLRFDSWRIKILNYVKADDALQRQEYSNMG